MKCVFKEFTHWDWHLLIECRLSSILDLNQLRSTGNLATKTGSVNYRRKSNYRGLEHFSFHFQTGQKENKNHQMCVVSYARDDARRSAEATNQEFIGQTESLALLLFVAAPSLHLLKSRPHPSPRWPRTPPLNLHKHTLSKPLANSMEPECGNSLNQFNLWADALLPTGLIDSNSKSWTWCVCIRTFSARINRFVFL